MKIGEFARATGTPADTLRYYEKIGLLRRIGRDSSGQRAYGPQDLAWVEFIRRLKDTGMPLKEILRYADLRDHGDSSLQERYELLREHSVVLSKRIEKDRTDLAKLKEKMSYYRREITHRNGS